nr:uncharacterized protein C1orf94 homolog [Camelus dromedarius]
MPSLMAGSSERSGASVMAGDKLLEPKVAVSVIGSQQDCDSALPKVTSILRAAKVKSAKGAEDRGRSLGASNMEIGQLLSQFPLKSTEMAKVPEEMVLEETRVIKDFLQNSMFSGPGPKEPGGLGPFLLLPPPPPPAPVAKLDKLLEIPAPKKQLPVFAKICSKPEADPAVEEHRLMEWNPGTKELTKARQSLLLSQWTQSQKEPFGEEGCSDPMGSMSVAPPTKKPAWPAEKNLLYEFLGATKNPSGQLRLRSKVEVDGLELKLNPPATGADKNNLKYTGNVSTPRFATGLTSATLNQPLWLNLNYPPPPVFTNPATFPQCQQPPHERAQKSLLEDGTARGGKPQSPQLTVSQTQLTADVWTPDRSVLLAAVGGSYGARWNPFSPSYLNCSFLKLTVAESHAIAMNPTPTDIKNPIRVSHESVHEWC